MCKLKQEHPTVWHTRPAMSREIKPVTSNSKITIKLYSTKLQFPTITTGDNFELHSPILLLQENQRSTYKL